MRHLNGRRKFGMDSSQRLAMLRNMVTSLLKHGKIRTTDTRAKEIRPIVERVITMSRHIEALPTSTPDEQAKASQARVHAFRMAGRWVVEKPVLTQLFNVYGKRFKDRNGGYTRIVKLGFRPGDNAPMSMIELLPES